MNLKVKDLRQQRAALIQEMQDLTTDAGKWNAKSDTGKFEAQERWAAKDAEQKSLKVQYEAIEATDALSEEMRAVKAPPLDQPNANPEVRTVPGAENATTGMGNVREKLASKEYRTAFFEWMRTGSRDSQSFMDPINSEYRTYAGLATSTSGDGAGYTIPIGFQKELETRMLAYGRMRDNCRILTTSSGNTLDWPTMDDTTNTGEFLAEANPVTQLNPTFNQIQFNSYLASSKQVLINVQLLQDSAFDMEAEVKNAFAIRLGRILNNKYTLGTGSSEPQGLIYAIQHDAVPNVVDATGSNSNDGISGSTEANSIGSDDLENLISAVDPSYRPNGVFMMHWKTIDFARKIKDKYGRPLWQASITENAPDRIYGYKYDWNADMDQIGANKYPIVFGDFSKHVIRDVAAMTMVRFNELDSRAKLAVMPTQEISSDGLGCCDANEAQAEEVLPLAA